MCCIQFSKFNLIAAEILLLTYQEDQLHERGVIRKFAENSCHFYIVRSIELESQQIILQHICG